MTTPCGICKHQSSDSDIVDIMLNTKPKARLLLLDVLLDGVERENKKDSWDYTGGHLNHNHLFKPQVLEEKNFWASGKIPDQQYENVKKDSFITFTLKTSLVNADPKVKSFCSSSPILKPTGPSTPINTPFGNSVVDTRPQTTCQENSEDKKVTGLPSKIPELNLPELKLLKFGGQQTFQENKKEYQFLPAYFTGLTKSDQFNMFLKFNRKILQKQDLSIAFYKNVTVEYYERKLFKELQDIAHIRPPHYARLQIFRETFGKICKDSSIFGNILSEIKAAYDLYVDYLLDAQCSPQHEILMSEIAGMKKRPVNTADVEEVMQNVRGLEDKAFFALEHNDQLRNDLKTVLSNAFIPDMVSDKAPLLNSRNTDPASEQCNASEVKVFVAKRSKVLKTLMEVNVLEEEIRKNLTHALNAEATEQYIKDIQRETMKLQSSNDFLQRANKDLNSEIKRSLMKQKLTLDRQDISIYTLLPGGHNNLPSGKATFLPFGDGNK
ncbi:uncharacterized protein C6orf118 homolog isoform X2 [Hyla sarda]|uniref:uncharacterized protein C6orf118 homolog isoform X2 n=1 Tax=Hyla sarda TaxID=327740 RepID=UPI0024C26BD1|nr:uncharacterized protein C6orf118 homolog isoform X2 [Hyla sarda]